MNGVNPKCIKSEKIKNNKWYDHLEVDLST